MTDKEIIDLFVNATARVEFYWQFYVTFVVAVVGWMVSTGKPFAGFRWWALFLGYVLFAAMNILGLRGAYTFAEALRLDLLKLELEHLENVREALQKAASFEFQKTFCWVAHVVVGICLWVLAKKKGTSQEPATITCVCSVENPKSQQHPPPADQTVGPK